MEKQKKDDLRTTAMLFTGTLTEFALLKSMTQSKTLTAMVIIGLAMFAGLGFFLLSQ